MNGLLVLNFVQFSCAILKFTKIMVKSLFWKNFCHGFQVGVAC